MALTISMVRPAVGQEASDDGSGWNFKVAPYFIFPNMNGSVTIRGITADVDASPGDIFDRLDFGAMLFLEAATPKFAITFDGLYMNLGEKGRTPITGRETEADMKQVGAQANFLWRFAPWVEAGLGGRLNSLKGGLKAAPGEGGILPGFDVSQTQTWVDPLIAVRLTVPLESKWRLGIAGDYGGFGIGSDYAWQILPFVGYRFSRLFGLGLSYRVLSMKYETGSADDLFVYDMTTFGLQIGAAFHF